MKRCHFFWSGLVVLAVLGLAAPLAVAQFGASISGTVSDESGAVVPAATVTVVNQSTGVSSSATSNEAGIYRVSHLAPGTYTVTVEAATFRKYVSENVAVTAEAPRGLNVTLAPGPISESVNVTTEQPVVQTETASSFGTIEERQIVNLPQPGRNPYELVRLTPGVYGDGARDGAGNSVNLPQQVGPGGSNSEIFQTENQVQVSSNGQRVTANNITLDGVSVNSLDWGGAAVITPNQESVSEVTVVAASFSAEDGRNSGTAVKTVSKSGTNSLHGSGIAKFDDPGLNAYNKFTGPTTGTLKEITCQTGTPSEFKITAAQCPGRVNNKYRQFGGSLGGPILKDKLFFFFSYEGVRSHSSQINRGVKLESPAFEKYVIKTNPNSLAAKIFSTPGAQPRIASTTSETDCCSLDGRPLGTWYKPGTGIGEAIGNGPDGIPDWGLYDLNVPGSQLGDQFNGRIDYSRGKDQFFFSSYYTRQDNLVGGQRALEDVTFQPNNWIATVGFTRSISSNVLNDLRGNFTRWTFNQLTPTGQTNFGIPQIRVFDFDAGGLGDPGRILGVSRSSTTPAKLAQNTFAVRDTVSWVHGRHVFKFGGEYVREQNNNNQSGGARPDYQFRGLLNLANDACCFFEGVSIDPNTGGIPNGLRHFRTSDYAVFGEDQWKLRPNLTLTLGLRWEYFPPIVETNNLITNYVFGTQAFLNGTVQPQKSLYNPDRNNFGPRIGVAWSPGADGKTVFRSGFAISYNRNFGVVFENVRQNTPFFAEVGTCCFFDPGVIQGPPPGSNILYALGSSSSAFSYPANPNLAFGVAPDGALCGNPGCTSVTKVDLFGALPNEPNPYVYSFSAEMQRELSRNASFRIGYYGSRSHKLIRTIDLNRLRPGDTFDGNHDEVQTRAPSGACTGGGGDNPCPLLATPIPVGNNRFNRIFFPLPDVSASYDALIANITHRIAYGLTVSANYTWSHTIDTASYEVGFQQTDPVNQAIDRGNSDFDVRHNFVLSAVWDLPIFRGRHDFLGGALGGWTISTIFSKHTGYPFSALIGTCDPNNDRNGDATCPDLPANYFGGIIANPSKQQWINGVFPDPKASFDVTTRGPGCRCRNIFTGPGYADVDLTLGKDFVLPKMPILGESARLNVRANAFNVFNILNLATLAPATAPTDILNTGQFGKAPNGLSGRVVELQARFSF